MGKLFVKAYYRLAKPSCLTQRKFGTPEINNAFEFLNY